MSGKVDSWYQVYGGHFGVNFSFFASGWPRSVSGRDLLGVSGWGTPPPKICGKVLPFLIAMLCLKFSMAFSLGSETVPRGIPRHSKSNRLLSANSADLLSITGSSAGNGAFRTAAISFLCLLLTLAFPLHLAHLVLLGLALDCLKPTFSILVFHCLQLVGGWAVKGVEQKSVNGLNLLQVGTELFTHLEV